MEEKSIVDLTEVLKSSFLLRFFFVDITISAGSECSPGRFLRPLFLNVEQGVVGAEK